MANRLKLETSPYLLQHSDNPVDWYPWSDEAFLLAKEEDKPILLSIGYSTCHWCHVMEKESFEDPEVAKLMNNSFVNIKVDREERPDIDNIYMAFTQMLTGHGGWPMTVIITPDKKPFFAGTYFPKNSRFGRIGMLELIPKVVEAWKSERKEILETSEEIIKKLLDSESSSSEKISETILDKAFMNFQNSFDSEFGGFGSQPKFPSAHNLVFLLYYAILKNNKTAKLMVEKTLNEMRDGGIYDQIGFGFHRYSTDKEWLLPHFEKMLYDNALLLWAYSFAYKELKKTEYKDVVNEIVSYLETKMLSKEFALYSAEDADSEGEEGKFYLWRKSEIDLILGNDSDIFCFYYGIESNGNYYDEQTKVLNGNNIPNIIRSKREVSLKFNKSESEITDILEKSRLKLYKEREKRIKPSLDDKVLTDWNCLTISCLAKAGINTNNLNIISFAKSIYKFIENNLIKDKDIFHSYKAGVSKIDGFLDDYAYFIRASLDLFKATNNFYYLKIAVKYQNIVEQNFYSSTKQVYEFISKYSEKQIINPSDLYDGAIPSGNSISALNLIDLFNITGNIGYYEKLNLLKSSFASKVNSYPHIFSVFLMALIEEINNKKHIICLVRNEEEKAELTSKSDYKIENNIMIINEDEIEEISSLIPYVKGLKIINDKITFFTCENFSCSLPSNNMKI